LLLLAGTAPLLPWRVTNRARALRRLRVPVIAAALTMVATALAGVDGAAPLAGVDGATAVAGFGLATLVLVANGQEVVTGSAIGRRGGRGGILRAMVRGRRRYAGLVVHVGLALAAAGITASSTLGQQTEVTLKTGQSAVFGGYILRYEGLRTDQQAQRVVLTAPLTVKKVGGGGAGTLDPRMNLYPAASEPIGSPSIQRGVVWDLYASVISLQEEGDSATFRFYRNPGVNWLWLGGFVMALGGVAAVWPAQHGRDRHEAPVSPAPARTADKVGAV